MFNEFDASGYLRFLESVLTPARLQHSIGVMGVMGELAKIYALDEQKALTAGLLHDAAKDLSSQQVAALVAEARIEFRHPCEHDYVFYLHGPVGAYYVNKELGVQDRDVLDAITRHTWFGRITAFEPALVWCLRFSDILEPNRRWDDAARTIRAGEPHLREAVYAGRLAEAALIQTDMLIRFIQDIGKPVHPNYHQVFADLSAGRLAT